MLREPPGGRRGQLGRRARCAVVALLALAPGAPPGAVPASAADRSASAEPVGRPGGRLVVALRSEPKTLNPVLAVDAASLTVIRRITADLIHINRESLATEPALAESWTVSPDGRRYAVRLRRGLRFSDGHPFDAGDVVFSFRVYLDEKVAAPLRDLLLVGGEPIRVRALDAHTVELDLAAPYAAGERLFDNVPILPEHRLGRAYAEGRLAQVWGLGAAAEIAGLGPFRLRSYVPGERVVLERNPHYWKVDRAGQRLPYLDEMVLLFVGSEDAQVLRFQAGETDLIDGISPKNFAVLAAEQARRGYRLYDLGPSLERSFLFFNLNQLPADQLPRIRARQAWFRDEAFRRAVSAAIDRNAIVRLVYLGRATPLWTNVSPGDRRWFNAALPEPPHAPARARELLRAAGFSWGEDGRLRDAGGAAVEFSIVTSSSNSQRLEMATIVQDDLRKLGIEVQVVALEQRALVERITRSLDYEAAMLAVGAADADPNPQMSLLMSDGSLHLWHLEQRQPATAWEAEIDRLMRRQLVTLDPAERKRLFDRVQEVMADKVPLVFLASPNVLVGARAELGNFRPAILDHHTLWNADELYWQDGRDGR